MSKVGKESKNLLFIFFLLLVNKFFIMYVYLLSLSKENPPALPQKARLKVRDIRKNKLKDGALKYLIGVKKIT